MKNKPSKIFLEKWWKFKFWDFVNWKFLKISVQSNLEMVSVLIMSVPQKSSKKKIGQISIVAKFKILIHLKKENESETDWNLHT